MHTTATLPQANQPVPDSLSFSLDGLESMNAIEGAREYTFSSGSEHGQSLIFQKKADNKSISCCALQQSKSTVSSKYSTGNYDHRLLTKISKQFRKLVKNSSKVKCLLRSITTEIRSNIISSQNTSFNTQPSHRYSNDLPQMQANTQDISAEEAQPIAADCQIINQPQFRGLLKPMTIDNDVPSDSQDLNRGVGMMYGELLYSVGEQLIANRSKVQKVKKKKRKQSGFNKENEDFNVIIGQNKNEKVQQKNNFSLGNPQNLRFDIMH